jgi:hypothetical protein
MAFDYEFFASRDPVVSGRSVTMATTYLTVAVNKHKGVRRSSFKPT